MATKILLIGSGAREHAMGHALARSARVKLYIWAGNMNPGLELLASEMRLGKMDDIVGMVEWAQELRVEFVVVGPELPLAVGLVDALRMVGISAVGPSQAAAQLESSKAFARELLNEAGIDVCPAFLRCRSEAEVRAWVREWGGEFVVKPDGLTGGKGVRVQGDHFATSEAGVEYALQCLASDGQVLLEEKLVGQEFSLMSFTDGHTLVHMPVVQDNKRLLPGDKGPNTGGMGSVSDSTHTLPFLGVHDLLDARATNERVVAALRDRGVVYKGVLYGNYIATRDGVKLIEYNARLGDPEAMNVMTLLTSDFVKLCQGIVHGNLGEVDVRFAHKATVCKYVVPDGYPDSPVKDVRIYPHVSDSVDTRVYYASVDSRDEGLFLAGSRAVGVVGIGDTIEEAESLAEVAAGRIEGPVVHREDIGTEELLGKRAEMMREIRKK